MRESIVQRKFIRSLREAGWEVLRIKAGAEGGWPDTVAFRNGEAIFVEFKGDKGKLSELQRHRRIVLTNQNFSYYLIEPSDDFKLFINLQ
jgi:Holliday junction resolvase